MYGVYIARNKTNMVGYWWQKYDNQTSQLCEYNYIATLGCRLRQRHINIIILYAIQLHSANHWHLYFTFWPMHLRLVDYVVQACCFGPNSIPIVNKM